MRLTNVLSAIMEANNYLTYYFFFLLFNGVYLLH